MISKPIILVFPFNYLSHYLRCIELARLLRSQFDLRFAYHPSYQKFVTDNGFEVFHCESLNETETLEQVRNFDFSWLNEKDLERVFLSQVKLIDELNPVAVIGDAVPTLKMAAERCGVLFISLINGYLSKYFAGVRNMPTSHFAYSLVATMPEMVRDALITQGEALTFKSVHKPFRRLRERYGLSKTKTYLDELEGDRTLICDLPALFPQKNLPASYSIIGPLIYRSTTQQFDLPNLPLSKKTIFVSMGSTGEWEKLSMVKDERFSQYNIVTAGDKQAVLHAPHIIRMDFVDLQEMLPRTDLVICHGGNGTIYQALAFGIPLLCAPAHFEQEWNVYALEKNGLAGWLKGKETKDELLQMIDRSISNKNGLKLSAVRNQISHSISNLPCQVAALDGVIQSQIQVAGF